MMQTLASIVFRTQQRFASHAMRPMSSASALWSANTGEAINLGKGHPNPTLLPLSQLRDAFQRASERPNAEVTLMQYGMMQGNARLREQIAEWVANEAKRPTAKQSADEIIITTGSGPALSVICHLFSKPGDTIFVDSPGYFLSYYTFSDCGLKVVDIPTDEKGMDVDAMEEQLRKGVRPSLVYTVPIANNPTGAFMSEDRKKKLVQLSREYGFKIAADEVYQFLTWNSNFPTSLYEFDDPQNPTVFSINSFSKILGPGLRLGWITSNQTHIARLLDYGALHSGGGFNPFASAIITEMMDSGQVEKQVTRLRDHYSMTSEALCEALEEYVRPVLRDGELLHYYKPKGGFFCFVHLPDRINADELLDLAKKHGVSFFAGKYFSQDRKGFQNCIRLCFAFLNKDEIQEGVRRIGDAIKGL